MAGTEHGKEDSKNEVTLAIMQRDIQALTDAVGELKVTTNSSIASLRKDVSDLTIIVKRGADVYSRNESKIETIEGRQDKTESTLNIHRVYFGILGFFALSIGGAVIALIWNLITGSVVLVPNVVP